MQGVIQCALGVLGLSVSQAEKRPENRETEKEKSYLYWIVIGSKDTFGKSRDNEKG